MKKKWKMILSFVTLICILVACAPKEPANSDKDTTDNENVVYQEVADKDMPRELKKERSKVREERGYLFGEKDGNMYVYISMGTKPTGGYSLKLLSVERKGETTTVFIEEASPSKDMMVTQAMSQPKLFVEIEGTTKNLEVIVPDKGFFGKEMRNLTP